MSIRTKLVAVLALILVGAVGSTGSVLILQHARHDRALLAEKQLLLVEHAAFSMQENLSVAARELVRLSKLPQIDPADNDLGPERELLYSAHQNSVFFKEVRVLSAGGRLELVQPEGAERVGESFAARTWFADARKADQPFFYTVPEHGVIAEAIAVIVPLRGQGKFTGAIQGILDLRSDKVITPELQHTAGALGEVLVVDRDGRVILPAARQELLAAGWSTAVGDLKRGGSGTLHDRHPGEDHLYAWAPVGGGTWGVAMRWPWRALERDTEEELKSTAWLLVCGIVLAGLLGVAFAAYLSRPLIRLGEMARRIARGEAGGAEMSRRGDEVGDLHNAFHQMEENLAARDRKINEQLEEIRGLNTSLEERVRDRTRQLEEAQARLLEVERFAAMGKTAAAIAHELKNALNGLGMCVDLVLADTPPAAGGTRVRAQIHREIARLRDVTESLLTFSRTPRLDAQPADVNALVRQALEVLTEPIADSAVATELDLDGEGAPLIAPVDGYKLQGALINLIKNGVEAMATRPLDLDGDGSQPMGRERRLTVRTRRGESAVEIEIEDTGPGVSAEARAHLYEPFFTTKVTGTGLGLATAKRVIDAHGGRLEAIAGREGAHFRIVLPLAPPISTAA